MDCVATGGNVKGNLKKIRLFISPQIEQLTKCVCVFTVQCWPKQSIRCPGSVMTSMLSLRKMGWVLLTLASIYSHFLFVCMSSLCFRFVCTLCVIHQCYWLFSLPLLSVSFRYTARAAVCELLSVGICLLPVCATFLQQVQTVFSCTSNSCVCVFEQINRLSRTKKHLTKVYTLASKPLL